MLEEERWATVGERTQAYKAWPAEAVDFLGTTAQWATNVLAGKVTIRTEVRSRGWRAWLKEQGKQGGVGLDRFVKRAVETIERPFILRGMLTASPQDIADNDLLNWEEVWCKHQAVA